MEKDFESDPSINFRITAEWFKDLYTTNKGRRPAYVNAVEAYISLANKKFDEIYGSAHTVETSIDFGGNSTFGGSGAPERHSGQSKGSIKMDSLPKEVPRAFLSEELSSYYESLIEEFSEIRLDVVNFRMPITNYIKTPVFESNDGLFEKKKVLVKKLDRLINDKGDNSKRKDTLKKEIREIDVILSKSHSIFNIINLGKDVFIKAPAGRGKSTTLRWLTYHLAQTAQKDAKNGNLPIFIELKYYTKKVESLATLIADSLNSYGLTSSYLSTYRVLLLLDGYDEYGQNTNKLFKEIIEFKRKNANSLIIFTGRFQPNFSAHQLDFVVYRLAELGDDDIETMFKTYLGNESGGKSFELVENIGAKEYLRNPLYSTFVLTLIKNNLNKDGFDVQDIKEVIINKGLLLNTLIVDKFIRSYEADKADISVEKRKAYKRKEIDALAKLAFHMTYDIGDIEQIEVDKAISLFKNNKLNKNVIDDFTKHSILKLNEDFLIFDKKEIRLFFTAKELTKRIKGHEQFISYKESLKTGRAKRPFRSKEEMTTWEYIEGYLLGMIDSEQIIDLSLFPEQPGQVILSNRFLEHFKLLLRKFDQGYPADENSYLNRDYIIKLVQTNVLAYKIVKEQGYRKKYFLSPYFYFRRLPKRLAFIKRFLPTDIISRSNIDFLERALKPDYMWFTTIARRYDIGVGFTEYLESYGRTYILDKTHKEIFFLGIFKRGGKIAFSKEEITHFIYQVFFCRNGKNKDKTLSVVHDTKGSYSRGIFVERKLQEDFDSFINCFYQKHPSPSKFIYLKLLIKLRKSGWCYPIRNLSSYSPNIRGKVLEALFVGATNAHLLKRYYLNKYLFDLVENIRDMALKEELSDRAFSLLMANKEDKRQNINAVILILITGIDKNVQALIDIVARNKSPYDAIVLKALKKLTEKLRYNTKVFKQSFMAPILMELVRSYPKRQSVLKYLLRNIDYTSPELVSSILELAENADKEIYYTILLFLSHNAPKEAAEFLENQLDVDHYGTWCYHILYRIDPKYHFKYKEKFKIYSISLYADLVVFESDPNYPIENRHIRKLLYLCDEDCIDLFHLLLHSPAHHKKLQEIRGFHGLKNMIDEKLTSLFAYKVVNGQ